MLVDDILTPDLLERLEHSNGLLRSVFVKLHGCQVALLEISAVLLNVVNRIIKRIADGEITTSKNIRDLKPLFREPVAREVFLKDDSSLENALAVLPKTGSEGVSGSNYDYT